ncbi:hypothetical protein [Zhaonella formicivorans]|jgi:hypothetical protein|uniref:hypothetical protein n=1 Tax=Zhaonella formicivorans TaxID=2528593 RepID=UPI001D1041C5|nr:hypothetical protein [Zhaonella formicivorans]
MYSSGYSNDPVMANFQQYGFKAVIAKPYDVVELSKVLKEVLAAPELDSETEKACLC